MTVSGLYSTFITINGLYLTYLDELVVTTVGGNSVAPNMITPVYTHNQNTTTIATIRR